MRLIPIILAVAILCPAASLYASATPGVSAQEEKADTIYLKNSRSINGIVSKEGKNSVEMETEGGSVVINRSEIKRIERVPTEALDALKAAWSEKRSEFDSQRKQLEEEREKRFKEYGEWVEATRKRKASELKEGEVAIWRDPESRSILVEASLNNGVKATLLLDTGAAVTVVTKEIGEKLGVNVATVTGNDVGELRLAGGKTVKARMVNLKSLSIGGIEEKDIATAVLLEDQERLGFKDGLLGRSFLNRFNISIDLQAMKMSPRKIAK